MPAMPGLGPMSWGSGTYFPGAFFPATWAGGSAIASIVTQMTDVYAPVEPTTGIYGKEAATGIYGKGITSGIAGPQETTGIFGKEQFTGKTGGV